MGTCASCTRDHDQLFSRETARGTVFLCPLCFARTLRCAVCGVSIPPGFSFGEAGQPPLCEDCEPVFTTAECLVRASGKGVLRRRSPVRRGVPVLLQRGPQPQSGAALTLGSR